VNLQLPKRSVAAVVLFAAVCGTVLLYMLFRLGAVPVPGEHKLEVRALVANADGLPAAADVLVHGVKVGEVTGIEARRGGTLVMIALDSGSPALHPDATVQIGSKTPLGEPFVDLDPGHAPGRVIRSGSIIGARSAVQIDGALAFLDSTGRANLRAALTPLGRGAGSAGASAEVGQTLAQLAAVTGSLGTLAAELRAQRADLTGTVGDGRVVLDVLAQRAAELRGLTVDADTTLTAVADQRAALGGVLDRLPGLLSLADATLRQARPLVVRATPVVNELTAAAPDLTSALRSLPSTTDALERVLAQATAIKGTVVPALASARSLSPTGTAALAVLGPALADTVPVAQYLAPRANTIAAWFSNTAALGSHGDAKGDWARFFVMFDPSTLLGLTTGAPSGNSYAAPGDAAHNAAYQPGGYPRLMPYSPALGG
jgi:phospholipid/cholesterol/gamma-HCH transport system substrate-binding protein